MKNKKMREEWLEEIVGDANDKAKDYFTKGEIEFISTLLSKKEVEVKRKIMKHSRRFDDGAMSAYGWMKNYIKDSLKSK